MMLRVPLVPLSHDIRLICDLSLAAGSVCSPADETDMKERLWNFVFPWQLSELQLLTWIVLPDRNLQSCELSLFSQQLGLVSLKSSGQTKNLSHVLILQGTCLPFYICWNNLTCKISVVLVCMCMNKFRTEGCQRK